MKKIDLGQTITILANLGVISGIGFLGFELQQNNESLQAQSRYNHAIAIADFFGAVGSDTELGEILIKARSEPLTEVEEFKRWNLYMQVINLWQWEYHEELLGRIDAPEESWIAILREGPDTRYPGIRTHWEMYKGSMTIEFREFIDQRLGRL